MNRAKSNKIKVYTIGIGNAGEFNAGILREIAQGTGAEFFSANSIQGSNISKICKNTQRQFISFTLFDKIHQNFLNNPKLITFSH
jgi:Ca-activated chloride channel family protein